MTTAKTDNPNNPSSPKKSKIRIYLIFVLVLASAFFIERQLSIWWGKYTVTKNDLPAISLSEAQSMLLNQGQEKDQKLILANFSAYWCSACRFLESNILADSAVKQRLTDNYVYVRLEETEDEFKPLFQRYQITSYPTLLLLNEELKVVRKISATRSVQSFLDQL